MVKSIALCKGVTDRYSVCMSAETRARLSISSDRSRPPLSGSIQHTPSGTTPVHRPSSNPRPRAALDDFPPAPVVHWFPPRTVTQRNVRERHGRGSIPIRFRDGSRVPVPRVLHDQCRAGSRCRSGGRGGGRACLKEGVFGWEGCLDA